MFFILDTWLDNKIPSIRIISKETGKSILEFRGSEVQQLLDNRVIDAEDLYSRNNNLEKEIIYELFDYARQQNQILHEDLKTHILPAHTQRKKSDLLSNTFNRMQYLRKAFFSHYLLKLRIS